MTEGPLIDLSAAQPMRGQYSGHVTSVDQSEAAQPETDAERLAKLKVRRLLSRRSRRREKLFLALKGYLTLLVDLVITSCVCCY